MLSLAEVEENVSRLRLSKKYKELSVNIFFLLRNLKPGVLWDFGKVDIQKLLGLKCIISDLLIIVLGVDIFITSKTVILQSLTKISDEPPYFINIGRTLKQPEPASSDVVRNQTSFVSYVLILISEATEHVVTVELRSEWNLCSVFGILLGFPVVYYSDQEEGNCLAGQDLVLYKVRTDLCSPTSFSVPADLEPQATVQISGWEGELGARAGAGGEVRITREIVNLSVAVV